MTRILTPALVAIGLLAAAVTMGPGPAAAGNDQADEAIARGLAGFVASATGYAMPSDADIACLINRARSGCGPINRTAALDGATAMVASSVDMTAGS